MDQNTLHQFQNLLKDALVNVATKDDLKNSATKDDLKNSATKDDLKNFATKDDLAKFATKQDLKNFTTKEDLAQLEQRLIYKIDDSQAEIIAVVDKHKADKSDVLHLEKRVSKLEQKISL